MGFLVVVAAIFVGFVLVGWLMDRSDRENTGTVRNPGDIARDAKNNRADVKSAGTGGAPMYTDVFRRRGRRP